MSTYQAERKVKATAGAEQHVDAERSAERPVEQQLYLLRYPWQDSPIKVGRAHDVAVRICQLESGHNFRLQLLAVFPGLGPFEHKAHALLSNYRASGGRGQEWFQITLPQALLAVALCVHSGPPADPAQ